MSTSDALMGLGMAAQSAEQLGGNPVITVGAANASQTGAAVIISKNTELSPGSTTNSFIFPAGAGIFDVHFFHNEQATTANVYPPVGHSMNGVANQAATCAQHASLLVWQYKPKFWASK